MLHTDVELGFGHFLYHSGDFFFISFCNENDSEEPLA